MLCDSQVSIGAIRKMRSSSYPLLRQLRSIAGIFFATGIRLVMRWIPSRQNPADGPSRGVAIGHQLAETSTHSELVAGASKPVEGYARDWHL